MHGQTSIAFQASAGGHARHAGTTRQTTTPADPGPRPPGNPARIPALSDAHGDDVTGRWPLRSFLELGALPSAVPCARLHTRQLLWEWQLTALADSAELVVSEITTNAIQASRSDGRAAPVRLWLLADRASLLILVGDASPLPPVRMNTSGDAENGRGLLLVEALSTRWGFFAHHQAGKVVWATIQALLTTPAQFTQVKTLPGAASAAVSRRAPVMCQTAVSPRARPARHPGRTLPAHFPCTRDRPGIHLRAVIFVTTGTAPGSLPGRERRRCPRSRAGHRATIEALLPMQPSAASRLAEPASKGETMTDANQFTIDTGRGYQITGRAEVDGDLLDIVLSRADRQPFANGQTEFSVTLSIDDDLT